MRERKSQPQERTYYKKLEFISEATRLRLRRSGKPKSKGVNRSDATLGEKFILYQVGNDYLMLCSLGNDFERSVRYFFGCSIEGFLKNPDGEPYVYERKREQDVDENIKPKP